MKIQEELKTLIKEGEYRKNLILTLVHHSVSILGELVSDDDATYRVSDNQRQNWQLRRLFIQDGKTFASLFPDNDEEVTSNIVVPVNNLSTEDLLPALNSLLEKLGSDEIDTRIKEKADNEAIAEILKQHNLSSEEELFLGENFKEGYQDEFNVLYSDLVDKYTDDIPYPGSVVCVGCGSTNVTCNGVVHVNTDRVKDWNDSAFYDGVCEMCGWAVLTDSKRVGEDIDKKLAEFKAIPTYAYCEVAYREKGASDIQETKNVWVKLSPRTRHDPDGNIFFYFQDIEEFRSYVRPIEGSEFVVIGIEEFSNAI